MKVILIGGGGNMKSVVSSISSNKNLEFDGYTDVKDNGEILGVKYLGFENDLDLKNKNVSITITYLKTPRDRDLRLFLIESLSQKKAIFPNIISKCTSLRSKINKTKGNLFINSCFINIYQDENPKDLTFYVAAGGQTYQGAIFIPYGDFTIFNRLVEARKKKENFFSEKFYKNVLA